MADDTMSVQNPPSVRKQTSTFLTIFIFLFAMFVLFDQDLRKGLGGLVGLALEPIIGLDGTAPVLTLVLAGIIMTGLTTILRHFFTDYVAQAKSQKIVSAFNKEFRQANLENNLYKIKKLTEQQNQEEHGHVNFTDEVDARDHVDHHSDLCLAFGVRVRFGSCSGNRECPLGQ